MLHKEGKNEIKSESSRRLHSVCQEPHFVKKGLREEKQMTEALTNTIPRFCYVQTFGRKACIAGPTDLFPDVKILPGGRTLASQGTARIHFGMPASDLPAKSEPGALAYHRLSTCREEWNLFRVMAAEPEVRDR